MGYKHWTLLLLVQVFFFTGLSWAASVEVTMNNVSLSTKDSTAVGKITLTDTAYGLFITPNLHGLSPGIHGFHVHIFPSCTNHGQDAGGHLDPKKTMKHTGPYHAKGHLGDLPALVADLHGDVTLPVLAPRIKVRDIVHHALMVHEGGDNYRDEPAPLGGGGARWACGVIN